jgi:hypothetical protein
MLILPNFPGTELKCLLYVYNFKVFGQILSFLLNGCLFYYIIWIPSVNTSAADLGRSPLGPELTGFFPGFDRSMT